jgi:hypothetical protein
MGNFHSPPTTSLNDIVKTSLNKSKFDLLHFNNLLVAHHAETTIKLTVHDMDPEIHEILEVNKTTCGNKIVVLERIIVKIDELLFQLTMEPGDDELIDMINDLNVVIIQGESVIFIKRLENMVAINDSLINNHILNVDRKK